MGFYESDGNPVFSSDGSKIAYKQCAAGPPPQPCQIDVMNPDGSGQTAVTAPPSGQNDGDPDFSPDGSRIVFQRCCDANGNGQIFVASVNDPSDATALTAPDANHTDAHPSFSPDGTQVVFDRTEVSWGIPVIASVPASGGDVRTLTDEPQVGDSAPTWQPAGAPIAPPPATNTGPVTTPARDAIVKPAGPAVLPTVAGRSLKVKKGIFTLPVGCPASATKPCSGTVVIHARLTTGRASKPRLATIGKARFTIQPARFAAIKVKLSKGAVKLLATHKTLAATASLSVSGGGASTTALKLVKS
jgi:hypothetical protein